MLDELPASLDSKTKGLPDERFSSASEVNEFSQMLIRADDPRAKNRARVQGLIDGNRPVPDGVMAAQQQAWRANVNYREAEGQVSAQRTPYYDLMMESDPCLEVEIDYGKGQQQAEWARKIAAHLHWAFHGNSDDFNINWHAQLQQSEMTVHGWGSHLFLSATDWRPSTWTMRHVLFPDGTKSCLDDSTETFVVRERLKAHQLNAHIRCPEHAKKIGWNPAAVKQAIVDSSKTGGERKTAEDYQSLVKNNDLGFGMNRAKETWLDHVFVREFEGGKNNCGGISHYIIAEGAANPEYLYQRRNRFDKWGNIIRLFPYDIGTDGTIHSIRGLGVRIFPFIELSNRLKNHMVDSVLVGSGVLLEDTGAADLSKLALTTIGPMKLLPKGVKPATYKFMDLSQGPLALSQELKATSDENNKTFRQSGAQRQYAATAEEIRTISGDQGQLKSASNNMYVDNLSGLYWEMARRIVNPNYTTRMPGGERAVEFQRRCLRDKIPKEALAKIVSVRATRGIGNGSASQRIQIAREAMQVLYPSADEAARYNIKRDYAAALVGARNVERYVSTVETALLPDIDDSMAVQENFALLNGGEALVVYNQNHFKHAIRHLNKAGELIQTLQQGGDPKQVYMAWNSLGPHIAAHLAYLEQDPTRKDQFKALDTQFQALSKMNDKLGQRLEEMAQAEADAAANAPQQQPVGPFGDPELDMKYMQTQGNLQIKAEKTKADIALKAEKQQASLALADAKTATDIRRANRKQLASGTTE